MLETKCRQVAFGVDVKQHLGNTLYMERVTDYQRHRTTRR